jgi:hypothetical protein
MRADQRLEQALAVIRAEAKRNPRFAAALQRALGARAARPLRRPPEEVLEAVSPPPPAPAPAPAPEFNPIALLRRSGAAGLRAALAALEEPALRALIAEHHLDPAGASGEEAAEALAERIVRAAEKRLERDQKLFAY